MSLVNIISIHNYQGLSRVVGICTKEYSRPWCYVFSGNYAERVSVVQDYQEASACKGFETKNQKRNHVCSMMNNETYILVNRKILVLKKIKFETILDYLAIMSEGRRQLLDGLLGLEKYDDINPL